MRSRTRRDTLDFDGTVAPTDLSRATDAREKGRIGIFGSQLSYAGSSGRVTSEPLGRDLNPLGRGDGGAYVAGAVNLGVISPRLPGSMAIGGTGNSVNNGEQVAVGSQCRCNTCWADVSDLSNPTPEDENSASCPDVCTAEQWKTNLRDCKIKHCECIALGCLGGRSLICDQEGTFKECGCYAYGTYDPGATGLPGDCSPGKWHPKELDDSSDSGSVNSNPSVRIDDTSCKNYSASIRQQIEGYVKTACDVLLSCNTLSEDVKKCLRKFCSEGTTPLVIRCDGVECSKPGTVGFAPGANGFLCYRDLFEVDIVLCIKSQWSSIGAPDIAHELLHICDCKSETTQNPHAKNPKCKTESKVITPEPIRHPYYEAFAENCTRCCFETDREQNAYYWPEREDASSCCLCEVCY